MHGDGGGTGKVSSESERLQTAEGDDSLVRVVTDG